MYDSEKGNIRIALTGDSLVTRPMSIFGEGRFLALREVLQECDYAVTNTEMLFHDYESSPVAIPGGSYMRADPSIIEELAWLGINAVCAANNHAYDYGNDGLLTHLSHLNRSSIVQAGLGKNLGDARSPAYLDTVAGRVALIGISSSGPQQMAAEHQWRDGAGRPGVNMIRYTSEYTVPSGVFNSLRDFRDGMDLIGQTRRMATHKWTDHSYFAAEVPDTDDSFYMSDLADRWQYPAPNGARFRRGSAYSKRLIAFDPDVKENLQRISEARRMADWVVVSMHNHESGGTLDEPAEFVESFARSAIDAGADIFHGHGPHRDRGIEMYKGKPIFYSIGHFINQVETVERVARENILRQRLDPWESTAADFYDARSGDEARGVISGTSAIPEWWRDFIAVVTFQDWKLSGVELLPIELGWGRARPQRGRPVMADEAAAKEVFDLMARLSEPYGTKLDIMGTTARVRLQ